MTLLCRRNIDNINLKENIQVVWSVTLKEIPCLYGMMRKTKACFAGNIALAEARRAQRLRGGNINPDASVWSTPWKGAPPKDEVLN